MQWAVTINDTALRETETQEAVQAWFEVDPVSCEGMARQLQLGRRNQTSVFRATRLTQLARQAVPNFCAGGRVPTHNNLARVNVESVGRVFESPRARSFKCVAPAQQN